MKDTVVEDAFHHESNWISLFGRERCMFILPQRVKNVVSFGESLLAYFKVKGFPFKSQEATLFYSSKMWKKENLETRIGFLKVRVKESLSSKINPLQKGKEFVIVRFVEDSKFLHTWQMKRRYSGKWRLTIEEVDKFRKMLQTWIEKDNLSKLLYTVEGVENKTKST